MSESTEGAGVVLVAAIIMAGLLVAGGVGAYVWQRQQMVVQQQAALEARARAVAAAAMTQAEAARARTLAQRPDDQASLRDSAEPAVAGGTDDDAEPIRAAIRDVLQRQQDAWNDGDIDRFMEYYWKSDDLTFSSRGTVTRGWRGVLDRYKARYASPREMGELSFDDIQITLLGSEAAVVLGDWRLRRDAEEINGNFTLVLRRLDGKWLIIHDHTSLKEQP